MGKRPSSSLSRGLCIAFAAVVLLLAVFGNFIFASAAITAALRWGIAGTLLVACFFAVAAYRNSSAKWEDVAQGAAGAVTIVALFIAAGVYFLERKDRVRLQFDVSATRVFFPDVRGASRVNSGTGDVLLGIRVLVTNNSARRVELNCISLGVFGSAAAQTIGRSADTPEEMHLDSIIRSIPYERDDGNPRHAEDMKKLQECLADELRRRNPRPLFMWRPLRLEPSDADDLYFELPINCRYRFVRVLVKLRLNPGDRDVYETKAIVPLAEVCEGRASGMARSVTPDTSSEAGAAESTENPGPAAQ